MTSFMNEILANESTFKWKMMSDIPFDVIKIDKNGFISTCPSVALYKIIISIDKVSLSPGVFVSVCIGDACHNYAFQLHFVHEMINISARIIRERAYHSFAHRK